MLPSAYGLHALEALLNQVAAGIQSGLRLHYGWAGRRHIGMGLTVAFPHDQGAIQRLAEGPLGAHP